MNNQYDELINDKLFNVDNELTDINVEYHKLRNISTSKDNYFKELNLLTLPNEILAHILFFLTDARDHARLARTCSLLNNIFSLITRVQFISPKNLRSVGPILARYVKRLHFIGCCPNIHYLQHVNTVMDLRIYTHILNHTCKQTLTDEYYDKLTQWILRQPLQEFICGNNIPNCLK